MGEGTLIFEHFELILLFGMLAFLTHWTAWHNGLFSLPLTNKPKEGAPNTYQLIVIFGIYLGMAYLITPLLGRIIVSLSPDNIPSMGAMGWLQFFSLSTTFLLFFLFCLRQDRTAMKKIWKDNSRPGARSIFYDFGMGVLTWIISFPLIVLIGQLSDLLVLLVFGVRNYEQVAVRYLKTTLESPSMLAMAIGTILIAAPIMEEFLFRGCLQNWFKRFAGTKAAIPLASLCFALFHLAPSQGVGNISLFISLFAFACYLGFIYERQGSLFASIGLHMTFNAVSTIRILSGG